MNKQVIKDLVANGILQQWLDGKQMQINFGSKETPQWEDTDNPSFCRNSVYYRIRPEPSGVLDE